MLLLLLLLLQLCHLVCVSADDRDVTTLHELLAFAELCLLHALGSMMMMTMMRHA